MRTVLLYRKADAERNEYYINRFVEEGTALGVEITVMYVEEIEFGVKNAELFFHYQGKVVEKPDFVISRTIFPFLTKHLEMMGWKVFNNSKIAEICNDKAKTYQYLTKLGIPMIDTSFYQREEYERAEKHLSLPAVIKATDGHAGSQVFLIKETKNHSENQNESDTISKEVTDGINHSNFVVQPLVGKAHQDLRVYVIGKNIIGCVLRTSEEGFRSNYSLGGNVEAYTLKPEEEALVQKIIHEFEFGMVGIDFLIGDDGSLVFNEIEDVVGSRMLYHTSDVNFIRLYLEYMISACK